jgi:signal transduction histidine kinase
LQKEGVKTWVNISLAIGTDLFGLIAVDNKGQDEKEFSDLHLYHFSILGRIGTAALINLQKKSLDEAIQAFSHDHRHYLNALRGHAQVLYEIDNPQMRERSLQIIDAEITRLATLFDNILNFARAQQGTLEPKWNVVDVKKICESVLELFKPLFEQEGVVWSLEAEDSTAIADDLARW